MTDQGKIRLMLAVTAVLTIWLVVLPWLGRQGELRLLIDRNEAAGIDPSALYYTDLDHLEFTDHVMKRLSVAGKP